MFALRAALLWASCHLLEVSEMLFSQNSLKSVVFAAVLKCLGEGKNSGKGTATALHSPMSPGQRYTCGCSLGTLASFCPQLLLLRSTTLRSCQCCCTFAAVTRCCCPRGCCSVICHALVWPLVLLARVCVPPRSPACPALSRGQGEAIALLLYIYVSFISNKSAVHSNQTSGLVGCLT